METCIASSTISCRIATCGKVELPVAEASDTKTQKLSFSKLIGFDIQMQPKYCIITQDKKMRLFYKGVETEHFAAWEARQPDFHDITFTVRGELVQFHLDKDQVSEQTTEEFLVEQILQKDEMICELQREIVRLRRSYESQV